MVRDVEVGGILTTWLTTLVCAVGHAGMLGSSDSLSPLITTAAAEASSMMSDLLKLLRDVGLPG